MTQLHEVEGIGETFAKKLKDAGVDSLEELLDLGATSKGRKDLTEKSGIRADLILRWVNEADLFRIKGVGSEYAELLEAAGVDTVIELAKRDPEHLHAKMVDVNEKKNLVRQVPSEKQVAAWAAEAKTLPRKVFYD